MDELLTLEGKLRAIRTDCPYSLSVELENWYEDVKHSHDVESRISILRDRINLYVEEGK